MIDPEIGSVKLAEMQAEAAKSKLETKKLEIQRQQAELSRLNKEHQIAKAKADAEKDELEKAANKKV